jgi:hypothetical protein
MDDVTDMNANTKIDRRVSFQLLLYVNGSVDGIFGIIEAD